MAFKTFQARRVRPSGAFFPPASEGLESVVDEVVENVIQEAALSLRVNGRPFTVTLRTPGADRVLALGLLFSEGLVDAPADVLSLERTGGLDGADTWEARVKPRDALEAKLSGRSLASTSSCGYCGKTEWEEPGAEGPAPRLLEISGARLSECFEALEAGQGLFGRTGGAHGAALFSADGRLLALGEDVGRHNAVDKAIGALWEQDRLEEAALLCVSGRVSYEIASKTFRAGLPMLAAVSAPSSLAVEYCRERDITLAGFCRSGRVTLYSAPERVAGAVSQEVAA